MPVQFEMVKEKSPVMYGRVSKIQKELEQAEESVGIDPLTIITIITTLIGLFQNCKLSPSEAVETAKNPNLLQKLVLRRVMNNHFKGTAKKVVARREAVTAALQDTAATVTEEEMVALYEECTQKGVAK